MTNNLQNFLIRTDAGYETIISPDNQILTFDGNDFVYKNSTELSINEYCCINRKISYDNIDASFSYNYAKKKNDMVSVSIDYPLKVSENLSKWLAYLIANGCIAKTCIHFSSANPEFVESYKILTNELFQITPAVYVGRTAFDVVIHSVGVKGFLDFLCNGFTTARYKTVPEDILHSSKEVKRSFICGLFDCDSSYNNRGFEYSSASEKLIKTLQIMLLEFGISSTLKSTYLPKYDHVYWKLYVSSNNVDIMVNDILFDSIKYKTDGTSNIELIKRNPNIDVIPNTYDKLKSLKEEGCKRIGHKKNGMYYVNDKCQRLVLFNNFSMDKRKDMTYNKLSHFIKSYHNETEYVREAFKEMYVFINTISLSNYFFTKIKEISNTDLPESALSGFVIK